MYEYKEYVDCVNIKQSKDRTHRYLLEIIFKNDNTNTNSVLIIMKNPSKASKGSSDKTVNTVLQFLHNDFKKVYIMNLFTVYSTDSSGISDSIKGNDFDVHKKKNLRYLKTTIKKVDEVIFAWGNPIENNFEEYTNIVSEIKKIVGEEGKPAFRIDNKCPPHPQHWASLSGLKKNPISDTLLI